MNANDALNQIKKWIGNKKPKSYTRKGCKVSMANLRSKPANRVVLDVDSAYPSNKNNKSKCDFILFFIDDTENCLVSVPMELKRGDVNASQALAQLQSGATVAESNSPNSVKIDFVPILVHGGNLHKVQRNQLRKLRVIFRGEEYPINTTRCGHIGNIAQVLDKSTKR